MINIILSPFVTALDNILTPLFPHLGTNVTSFLTYVDEIASYMLFPLTFLPSSFISCLRSIVQIEFIWITASIGYHAIIKIFRIIHNVKFW